MRVRAAVAISAALLFTTFALSSGASNGPRWPAQHLTTYHWVDDNWAFGGLSGLILDDDGIGFLALSDRGHAFRGQLIRINGEISGVSPLKHIRLKDDEGNFPPRFYPDSEGLARHPNGRIYVSFEGFTRIWHYDAQLQNARWMKQLPNWRGFAPNGSIESIAIDARRRLHAIPEEAPDGEQGFPVYRFENREWTVPYRLSQDDRYLPVGADFGPDGALYVLERAFTLLQFRSRVRRFDIEGDSIAKVETLFESGLGEFDNLEGLSVWRDDDGKTRLTMVSDDNFKFFQRTEIVEYVLP